MIADFAASAITYRVRVWTTTSATDITCATGAHAIYYAFRRHGIEIPYPIQVEIRAANRRRGPTWSASERLARWISSPADDHAARGAGARRARSLYGAGEAIVREGEPGSSMFVIIRGEAAVTLSASGQPVARLSEGKFFGEMSLLTGDPRGGR